MNLSTKLTEIKGVGAKTAELLVVAGLETTGELINFLPRAYEDFSKVIKIADLTPGKVTIRARCEKISTRIVRRGMRITTAVLSDDSGKIQAVWFNQPYRVTQLKDGAEFFFSGQFDFRSGRYQLTTPSAEAVKDLPVQTGRILPIYPKRKGLKPNVTRKILNELRPLITMLPETLPTDIVKSEKLLSRADALLGLHFPESAEQADEARERLAFEELFGLILAARLNKNANSALSGYKIAFNQPKIKQIVADLPFTLTAAQKRALWDILCDFEKVHEDSLRADGKVRPMNRLLQGDVGSGKTVVAGAAAYQAAVAGFQTAFMAPTEILATQHAETLSKLLKPYGVSVALLTGSVKGKARTELLKQVADGKAQVVVGTHALFQQTVKFHKLGFVVIDEQHRFGVKQRQELLAKGKKMPHLLSMTATPIPRSLQLTLFGDLDISILNQMPKGRKPIKTEIISPNSRAQMNEKIKQELANGRQVYFIAPLIEESEMSEKESVEKLVKKVTREFKNTKIGVLHGKMKPEEKEKIMREFASGKTQILVATTVVEVGVDVPNATVIVIENADQFGLAQLHQLRGRVGRSEYQSFAFLVQSDSSAPTRRLREIEKSNDGFYLAEIDLQLRGAGEIYGIAQHGQLNLQIANLSDTKLIKRASKTAEKFANEITKNPEILANYLGLKQEIPKYQRLTTLN